MQPKFNNLLIIGWIYEVKAIHRRTDIVCQGDREPFAQKFLQVAQICTIQSKGNKDHTMH